MFGCKSWDVRHYRTGLAVLDVTLNQERYSHLVHFISSITPAYRKAPQKSISAGHLYSHILWASNAKWTTKHGLGFLMVFEVEVESGTKVLPGRLRPGYRVHIGPGKKRLKQRVYGLHGSDGLSKRSTRTRVLWETKESWSV